MTVSPPPTLQGHPTAGRVAQIAGVIGAVVCVLLIVGLWLGRGWLSDRVDGLMTASQHATAHAIELSDAAITVLEARAVEVDAIESTARQIAGDPAATTETLGALAGKLQPIADAYVATRGAYVSLREGVTNALDTVQRLDRLVRSVDIPDSLGSSLSSIDERLVAIDSAFVQVTQAGDAAAGVSAGATALANQAATLSDALRQAEEVGRVVRTGLTDVQAQLTSAAAALDDLLGSAAIALTLVLIWVLLLNVALWALGRRWRAKAV